MEYIMIDEAKLKIILAPEDLAEWNISADELDYNDLIRKLGIEGGTVKVAKTRRIKGRAIWYDKMKAQIIGVDELPPEEPVEEGNDE